MLNIRYVLIAGALVLAGGTVNAQTTVITREPAQTRTIVTTQPPIVTTQPQTVVTTEPLQLSPVQRQTIYRTITREHVEAAAPTVEYRVGARVPETVHLYSIPQSVAVEVPAVRTYKYMMVNGRVVLVDPATSVVVGEVR